MRYRMLFLILLALLMASCQGKSATQAVQVTAEQSPSLAAADTPVVATLPSKTAAPETPASVAQAAPPGCTVISPPPTPGATAQSLFPAVSDKDWVSGPAGAAITFTEYSDFQ